MFVDVTRPEAGVARIMLNRPERMNALSMAVTDVLVEALERVTADTDIGAIILTGAGRGFCAGGDIKEMHANRDKTLAQRRADLARMHQIPRLIRNAPQVVITAINGPAYGAGFGIALTGDIAVAAETATFGTAFLKQGLASDFGLSYQLVRLAGAAEARRIIFLDEVLTASEARALRLVARVASADALQDEALQMASAIARIPADARASMKRLLNDAETRGHDAVLDAEEASQIALVTSDGHAAAVDAFLAGRADPSTSGERQ